MKKILLIILFIIHFNGVSQNNIISLPFTYTQSFGSIDIAAWTDNTTFIGWYNNSQNNGPSTFLSHQNITTTPPSNSGGFYSYECNGDNNQKIGSRASGSVGTMEYGVRFNNQSGSSIISVTLDFDWYQLSLAGNGNISNIIQTSYVVANSVTNLTTGSYTNLLSFTVPVDTSSTNSGAQFRGIPCFISGHKTICSDITITNNRDIMIKWGDVDNTNNDHHIAIDNIVIKFSDLTCVALPIELISFTGEPLIDYNLIKWITASEINNDYFKIERSYNGLYFEEVGRVDGTGNSNWGLSYSLVDTKPHSHITYYRLIQTDFDGKYTSSEIISVSRNSINKELKISKVINLLGQEVFDDTEGVKIYYFNDGSVIKKYHK